MIGKARFIKYGVFLSGWVFLFAVLVFLSPGTLRIDYSPLPAVVFSLPSNRIGAFSYASYRPEGNFEPKLFISFDEILIENNHLSIFKSALHQVAKIDDFKFSAYHYPDNSTESAVDSSLDHLPFRDSLKEQVLAYAELLWHELDGWGVNFDISRFNVSELLIDDFDYSVFSDSNLVLSIKCSRARASYDSEGLELRGHVVVKAGDAKVLEANRIKWDYENKKFIVKSAYALNKDNVIKTGGSIVLDYELEQCFRHKTANNQNMEEDKCLAKL